MSSLFAVAVLVTSVFAAPPAPVSAVKADDMYEGRVVLSTKAALTIVAKNGDNVTFAIASSCKITRDGKPSNAEMIAPGDRVQIVASTEAGRNVANTITARGAERPIAQPLLAKLVAGN
ncbi:MAG: hypothetical protein K8U03_19840 [Planctomycetia bacterium]|nr:hypothetical protein [Planctomycetia bacterium]